MALDGVFVSDTNNYNDAHCIQAKCMVLSDIRYLQ